MDKLKVLYVNRRNALSHPGGDTVQMLKTKKFLEKNFNIQIEICLNEQEISNYKDFNLVHIFNIQTIDETLNYIDECKKHNKKIVLSPIYWDLSHADFAQFMANKFRIYSINKYGSYLKDIVIKSKNILGKIIRKEGMYGSRVYKEKRRKALMLADLLLPNSPEELEILSDEFSIGLDHLKYKTVIVPNAVDYPKNLLSSLNSTQTLNIKNYVLQVGRIEPIKNQAKVIQALSNYPNIPILFIGRVNHEGYYKYVKKLADKRGNVYFINEIQHEEVFYYYKNAAVHVMPSLRESPGLASLEAVFSGCKIVVSSKDFCPVHYYKFDEIGKVCNPYDVKSIEKAIIDSIKSQNLSLEESYLRDFSYENVAELTYHAYYKVLNEL
jgi:glycosyltransferase involved in cell wall biosynthesis